MMRINSNLGIPGRGATPTPRGHARWSIATKLIPKQFVRIPLRACWAVASLVLCAVAAADPVPLYHSRDEIENLTREIPRGAPNLAIVADPDASGGRAVEAGPRVGPQNSSDNFRLLEPGDYVATFRLKVADNTSPQVVFYLRAEGANAQRRVRANEFAAAGKYQDFDVPFDLTRPTLVATPVLSRPGNIVVWADCMTMTMRHRYGDYRQLELLGYKPPHFTLPANAAGVLVVRGLYHEFWHIEDGLAAIGAQASCVLYVGSVKVSLRGFPRLQRERLRLENVSIVWIAG